MSSTCYYITVTGLPALSVPCGFSTDGLPVGIQIIGGFKKVLAKSSATEDLYLYGSFIHVKFYQPEINKIYFDETLRGVTSIKIPKSQVEVNDWRKYYYNVEKLFNDFSKNIIKIDKKWLKEVSKNKIKKDLKNLMSIVNKLN